MEFSQLFGFFKILSESINLFLKNAKSIALITILSLLPSSILFLLFTYLYQSAMIYVTASVMNSDVDSGHLILKMVSYFTLIFAVEITFLLAYIAISNASGIATILASAASYSHNKLSLPDLYSTFKAKWRSPVRKNLRRSGNWIHFMSIFAMAIAVPLVMLHPNPITIAVVSVFGVSFSVYLLYNGVVAALASVIPVVEDGCEAAEALEKAENLVRGRRVDGFMVNLFLNLVWLIVVGCLWMIVRDNLVEMGLLFVNSILLVRIVMSVVYTVYYFQCMEYHGQKVVPIGNHHYAAVSSDIP